MIIDIYTDASFFSSKKIGGYAIWISHGGEILKHSGSLKHTDNSTEAETMAIANALYIVSCMDFKKIKNIVIITDSLQSIKKIKSKAKKNSPYKIAYKLLIDIRIKNNIKKPLKSNFRHVKAHEGLDSIDKRINKWCDHEAKKQGRAYLKQLNNKS